MAERARSVTKSRASAGRMRAPSVRRLARHVPQATHAPRVPVAHALLQPALKVGAANDPLEREAETMAERVVAMPAPQSVAADAPPSAPGAASAAGEARRDVDNQPSTDEFETTPPIPEDHQDPDVPPTEDVATEDLTAGDMNELETGKPVDTGGDEPVSETPPPAEETAQPARHDAPMVGAEGGAAPPDVARRVAQPGSGRPLPSNVRAFMEPRFGRDFSSVRIHDAAEDRRAARRIGARAFTHRDHIWMGPGESAEDRKLMAHELTHVVQQAAPASLARAVEPGTDTAEPEVRRGYIRDKAEKYARNVPGYRLISVIIGQSPITGETVEFNAINLLGGMMALIPGGNLLFERLEESRVLQEAFDWISGRLSSLNITWTRISGLISDLLDYLPDWPGDVVDYAKKLFRPLVDDIITFVKEAVGKVLEFIVRGALRLAGPWGDKVWEIIQAAGAVLMTILEDPLGFAKNLFRAVLKGFDQFGSHIVDHIKKGLMGWLFGTIKGLDITIPEKLDFKGLISIGLQIVGLTYANFRAILVKRLGENGERKVAFLEKSVEAAKILAKEGFVGLWQRALQMIDNFKQTIVDGIKDFVIKSLIMGGISWLAGLSNPVGAVIKIALAIYNLIKTFLERLDQILEVAKSIFSSIAAIAAGRIEEAADFIEKTMAATIPVVISFLAALVPITGITNSIRNIITKLRGAVERAIEKMITFVAKKAKKLFSKLIAKVNSKRKLPSANFTFGKKQHRIFAEQRGKKIEIMIASGKGHTAKETKANAVAQTKQLENKNAAAEGSDIVANVGAATTETGAAAATLNPDSKKDNQLKGFAALKAELKEAAAELQQAGADTANFPEIDTEPPEYLFRAKEPRFDDMEGLADEYSLLGKKTSKVISTNNVPDPSGRPYSVYYENDHIPEKQFPKIILDNIHQLKPGGGGKTVDRASEKAAAPASKKAAAKPKVGKLGDTINKIDRDGKGLEAMTIYRPVHIDKKSTNADDAKAMVAQASADKVDPVGKVKKLLAAEIKLEADKIVAIMRKDTSATDPIKAKIDAGIQTVIQRNKDLYALDEVEAPEKATEGATPEASLSELPISGDDGRGVPNFLDIEGKYQPHGSFPEKYGKYLEYDHVIDAGWPDHAKYLSFGDLKDQLAPKLEKAKLDKDDNQVMNRRNSLGAKLVFQAGQGVMNHDPKAGNAIAVYRPIHRVVTAQAKPPRTSLMVDAISDTFAAPLVKFIKSGDLEQLQKARAAVQTDMREFFKGKILEHTDLIANQYVNELQAVKAVNVSKEDLAQQAMVKISGTVRDSLTRARRSTSALF